MVALKEIEYALLDVLGDAGALVGDAKDDFVCAPLSGQRHRLAGRRESDRIGHEVEQNLPDPFSVGDETADIGGPPDIELERGPRETVAPPFRPPVHRGGDTALPQIKPPRARAQRP